MAEPRFSAAPRGRDQARVRAIFILSKSVSELLGPDHHVARAVRTAADDENAFNFELARTAFDRISVKMELKYQYYCSSFCAYNYVIC